MTKLVCGTIERGEDLLLIGCLGFDFGEPFAGETVGGLQGQQIVFADAGDGAAQHDLPVAALTYLSRDCVSYSGIRLAAHALQHIGGVLITHHIEVRRLTEIDLESGIEDVVESGVAGAVVEVSEDDLLARRPEAVFFPPEKPSRCDGQDEKGNENIPRVEWFSGGLCKGIFGLTLEGLSLSGFGRRLLDPFLGEDRCG